MGAKELLAGGFSCVVVFGGDGEDREHGDR